MASFPSGDINRLFLPASSLPGEGRKFLAGVASQDRQGYFKARNKLLTKKDYSSKRYFFNLR